MKLNNVKINYYKSFGEDLNNFQVENDITVIVGKNESGKSNLLQLLSKVDLLNGISADDLNKVNRKYSDKKPSIELEFKLDSDEKDAIKEKLEPIVSENIKNNLWEKALEILDLFSELYITDKEFKIVFEDLIKRDDKIIKKLSVLYEKFKINLNGPDGMTYYVEDKGIVAEIPGSGKLFNNILAELYQIFSLLNIDESLKIKFDKDLEDRIKERTISVLTEDCVKILNNTCKKYHDKYMQIYHQKNFFNFKEIDLNLILGLFDGLDNLRLSFEQKNKENIDNIISKKMNNIYEQLEYTKFILKEEKVVEIDGAFKIYFEYEKELENNIKKINDDRGKILKNVTLYIKEEKEEESCKEYIYSLRKIKYNINPNHKIFYANKLSYSNGLNEEEKIRYEKLFSDIGEAINYIYKFIPTLYLYEEKFLEDNYAYNKFLKSFNSENLMYLLLSIIVESEQDSKNDLDETLKEYLEKIFNNPLSGEAQDLKNKINKVLKDKIELDFNNFYNQENIQMSIGFDGNCISLFINSSDNTMNISERSRGLRWYLSMFIDMKANNLSDKKVIYLIDEPAVYLHPNAQKQVLEFLKSLTQNQNQLIYATHSPYMIDSDEFQKVRALQKEEGITKIYNKIYNSELSKVSKLETLSPILDAIGLDLRYNLGPSNQMLNIVTEGITDYMYISAMANYLEIEGIYILPSVGAPNVDQLACILIGWGLNFKILLDYDKAGNEAAKKLKNLNLEINKDYYFLTGKDKFNREDETVVIEDLVNEKDISEMKIDENAEKIIKARMFKTKVENKKVDLSEETVRNFGQLFESLGVYEREKEPILT